MCHPEPGDGPIVQEIKEILGSWLPPATLSQTLDQESEALDRLGTGTNGVLKVGDPFLDGQPRLGREVVCGNSTQPDALRCFKNPSDVVLDLWHRTTLSRCLRRVKGWF